MNEINIPVKPRRAGKHILTEEDKEYIKSFAVNGIIPFKDFISAVNEIINRTGGKR